MPRTTTDTRNPHRVDKRALQSVLSDLPNFTWCPNPDCAAGQEGPYVTARYDVVADDRSGEEPWERNAPRGRSLPGRMPEDYCRKR